MDEDEDEGEKSDESDSGVPGQLEGARRRLSRWA